MYARSQHYLSNTNRNRRKSYIRAYPCHTHRSACSDANSNSYGDSPNPNSNSYGDSPNPNPDIRGNTNTTAHHGAPCANTYHGSTPCCS